MIDYITYCTDSAALVVELAEKAPHLLHIDEETGEAQFLVDKTPTVRDGMNTLSLIRDLDGSLLETADRLDNLTVLGTYEEVFADPAKRAIYDSVYDQTPIPYTDEEGVEHIYTPPEKFGVMA